MESGGGGRTVKELRARPYQVPVPFPLGAAPLAIHHSHELQFMF